MGGTDERAASAGLLRQRAARCDGGRCARQMRRVFWHHGRAGVRVRRCRRYLGADCPRPSGRGLRGGADPAMIRVVLPAHLRALARVDGELTLEVQGDATLRAVLDAIEVGYPVLRGTIRDHVTQKRRPFVRFFACEEDLSHDPPDTLLPEPVARGAEPFLVVGAIAGG